MLTISGKVLEVKSETVNGPTGSFVSTTISLLSGKSDVQHVRVGRDYPAARVPKEGEDGVTLEVAVSAYATRNGAGYRLTALDRVEASHGQRVAAVS